MFHDETKNLKEISFPMKFNSALNKFEMELPILKRGKKINVDIGWRFVLILLTIVSLFTILLKMIF